jgi:hypothetical protein
MMLVSAATSGTFTTSATVTNDPPTAAVDTGQSATPTAAGSRVIYIMFNASDPNGNSDLNDATASVTLNKSGETNRSSSSCTVDSNPSTTTTRYNCSVTIYYWDASGTWTINAAVKDSTSSTATATATMSMSTLDAISIVRASTSFSGAAGTSDIAASPQQQVNNTGNQDYTTVQLTGFSFASGANTIGVGNVTMNVSNSGGVGQTLVNNSAVTLTGGSISKGNNSYQNIYLWLDIPAGTPAGTYNAQSAWTVATS